MDKIDGKTRFLLIVTVVPVILFMTKISFAIPTFARKYRTSCTTCHVAPPTLNTFGLAFRLNGYQFAENDEDLVKENPVPLGVEPHKELFPESIWPSTLPDLPPLSLRFFGDAELTPNSKPKTNFALLDFWRILSGGALDEHISYFSTVCFKLAGPGVPEMGALPIPFQAFLVLKDLLSKATGQDALNMRLGLIDLRTLEWVNFFQHVTISNYLFGDADSALDEEGNNFAFLTPGGTPGIELYGLLLNKRLFYAGSINNGDDFGIKDDNSDKDLQGILRYKLGGIAYDGLDKGGSTGFWANHSLQIGGSYYYGTAEVTGDIKDEFWRVGADLRFQHNEETDTRSGSFDITGAYLVGENEDPYGSTSTITPTTQAWFAELNYVLFPWLIPVFRYEGRRVDMPVDRSGVKDRDADRLIPNLTVRLRHNLRLTLEGVIYLRNDQTENTSDKDSVLFRFDIAV